MADSILIVEDDPVIRTFLADNLTADGYDLLVAGTIDQALIELESRRPDLAVVDLRLPDGSGLDLIRRVRSADGVGSRIDPALPLVVLSGCGGELDRVRGFERGADDYVVKPFAYTELRWRIDVILSRTRARSIAGSCGSASSRSTRSRASPRPRAATHVGGEGVRAAADARVGAHEGLHEGGIASRGLGLPVDRRDADPGLSRLSAASETAGAGRSVPRQRLGRRVPARRRAGLGGDIVIVALCSWCLTLAFVAYALRAHLRLVLVARACHELRGPLFAVQLGLHGLAGDPARMSAIELELARAGRALDDLAAAPRGRRGESRHEVVDLDALVSSYAPAWRALVERYGARLTIEPHAAAPAREGSPPVGATSPPAATASPAAALSPRAAALSPRAAALSPRAAALSPRAAAPSPPAAAPSPPAAAPSPPAAALSPPTGVLSPPPATVVADPLRIAQACANLIGNAAEHGEGEVRVRVLAVGRFVRVEVADDGPGLSASVAALTAHARARRGPRGHGLAIAAAIARDHGGRLFAPGARIVLELPAAGGGCGRNARLSRAQRTHPRQVHA